MTIDEKLQELKDWLDENPTNLSDSNIVRLTEPYERMKTKYNI